MTTKPTSKDTARAIFAMMDDVRKLKKAEKRVRVQILALAKRHGIQVTSPRPAASPG